MAELRSGFAVRPVISEDLTTLLKIERSVSPFPWSSKQFSDSMRIHSGYVLLRGKKIIGYFFYHHVLDQAELLNIAIRPGFQGEGHGNYLLDLCVDLLKDSASQLYLEVRASNFSAIELYLKKGFIQTGQRSAYYHSENVKEDALLMTYGFNEPPVSS